MPISATVPIGKERPPSFDGTGDTVSDPFHPKVFTPFAGMENYFLLQIIF